MYPKQIHCANVPLPTTSHCATCRTLPKVLYKTETLKRHKKMKRGATSTPAKRGRRATTKRSKQIAQRIPRSLTTFKRSGFPERIRATLRYADIVSPTSAALGNYVFASNGCYDPDITGTGHQPLYFDQYMAVYDHYLVVRSALRVTALPITGTPYVLTVMPNDDNGSTSVYSSEMESPGAANRIVTDTKGPEMVQITYKPEGAFTDLIAANPNMRGTVSTNPTEQQCFIVRTGSVDLTTAIAPKLMIEILYDVVFFELKTVTGS